jgi:hypothetical protein
MLRGNLSFYRAMAILAIKAERRRQIEIENRPPEHDDQYSTAQLRRAGECYFNSAIGKIEPGSPPEAWPWDEQWWKPHGPERDLVRAGALFEAEVDRLDRYHGRFAGTIEFPVRRNVRDVISQLAILYRHDDEVVPF